MQIYAYICAYSSRAKLRDCATFQGVTSQRTQLVNWWKWKLRDGSFISSVSAEENVGYFKNMRRECQIKNFDGLGPFSYVCRMIRFSEPNTKEVEHEVFVDSAFEESVRDQHYVCVVNPERVRGFPVEINLEEGEDNAEGVNDDVDENVLDEAEIGSGYVPTTPPKSDQGSDREPSAKRPRDVAEERVAPGPPDPEDPDDPDGEDFFDPVLEP